MEIAGQGQTFGNLLSFVGEVMGFIFVKTMEKLFFKNELVKKIKAQRKVHINQCWEYHNPLLKTIEGIETKKKFAENYWDISLEDWEDVGYFIGYLNCLDDMEEITLRISKKYGKSF